MNTITGIEAIPFRVGHSTRLVVFVDTESGHTGIGEAGDSGRELAVAAAVEHFKPLLLGEDANRIEAIWQLLYRIGSIPAGRITAAAASAVDIALWDLRAKVLGLPLYQLLGGAVRDRVVCYPHNGDHADVDRLLDSCDRTLRAGWKFVRWALGPQSVTVFEPESAIRLTLRQMAAVRDAFGEDVEICIDVHTRLHPSDAVRFCRAAEQYRPYFIEDPIRVENPGALGRLRAHTAVPLAAGEQYTSKWEFQPLIEGDLIDFARVDVCLAGGITEARKIAAAAETHYIRLATHNPLGPVSSAACFHLNLSISNFGVQEQPRQPGSDPVLAELFPEETAWSDGSLLPSNRHGLGVVADREALRSHGYEPRELPRYQTADGAFANW